MSYLRRGGVTDSSIVISVGDSTMRVMVDPRRHTVLVWAVSGRGYRLYAPVLIGRKAYFKKRLDFKSLTDERINDDARSHWERLERFEHPANITPGELAKFLGSLICGSHEEPVEYIGQVACPMVSGVRAGGFDLRFDFTC